MTTTGRVERNEEEVCGATIMAEGTRRVIFVRGSGTWRGDDDDQSEGKEKRKRKGAKTEEEGSCCLSSEGKGKGQTGNVSR